jgi:hypothetical protein
MLKLKNHQIPHLRALQEKWHLNFQMGTNTMIFLRLSLFDVRILLKAWMDVQNNMTLYFGKLHITNSDL